MYKVIYQKNDGKVVGCYPFEYIEKTEHFIMDSEGYELNVDETEEGAYPKTFLVESARFFYNKETCEAVDFETVPEYSNNQYLVYENGNLVVKNNLQNYEQLVEKYIRAKYSVSQEFAILRQKETKPLEYQEYFEYCEECKARAKGEIGG